MGPQICIPGTASRIQPNDIWNVSTVQGVGPQDPPPRVLQLPSLCFKKISPEMVIWKTLISTRQFENDKSNCQPAIVPTNNTSSAYKLHIDRMLQQIFGVAYSTSDQRIATAAHNVAFWLSGLPDVIFFLLSYPTKTSILWISKG